MKERLLLVPSVLLLFTSICFAQPQAAQATASPSPKPKPAMSKAQLLKKLSATETKLWEAWKNKDVKPFKAALAADFVIVNAAGVSGKNDVVKWVTSLPCELKSFKLSDWKLTMINSGTAFLTYKGTADGTCGGTAIPVTWASSVFVNRGGKWLAFSHQETGPAVPPTK